MNARTPNLTARDLQILNTVAMFGLITFPILHKLFFAANKKDAVKSTLRRLVAAKLIVPRPLIDKRVYYQLTPNGCAVLGAPRDRARRIGPQALPERYAVLSFCCAQPSTPRTLFTPGLNNHFPVDPARLRRSYFYLQSDEQATRMGHIVLDLRTTVPRLVRKTIARLRKYLEEGWLDEEIRAGLFTVTMLTLTDEKKESIARSLKREARRTLSPSLARLVAPGEPELPIRFQIHVVPDLDRLIP